MKGKAARKARKKGNALALACLLVHAAERARSGIEHPKRAIMDTGRMRHGKLFRHHAVIAHIHDEAARCAPVPPAGNDIASADRRNIAHLSLGHRESVQMAAILRREARNERRLPEWAKAV